MERSASPNEGKRSIDYLVRAAEHRAKLGKKHASTPLAPTTCSSIDDMAAIIKVLSSQLVGPKVIQAMEATLGPMHLWLSAFDCTAGGDQPSDNSQLSSDRIAKWFKIISLLKDLDTDWVVRSLAIHSTSQQHWTQTVNEHPSLQALSDAFKIRVMELTLSGIAAPIN